MVRRNDRPKKVVPKIPEAPLEAPQIIDTKADAEAKALANNTLEEEAALSDHKRALAVKRAVHLAAICVFFLWVFVYVSFVVVWGFHFITPATRHFLDASQITNLQSFVLSGTVATALAKYFDP